MASKLQRQKTRLHDNLMQLVQACPFNETNPQDCPLFRVRQLTPEQREEWFKLLTAQELQFLAAYHDVCLSLKLSGPTDEEL